MTGLELFMLAALSSAFLLILACALIAQVYP